MPARPFVTFKRVRRLGVVAALLVLVGVTPASAGGGAPAALWVTATSLDLGPVGVGHTSATAKVFITNISGSTVGSFAGGAGFNSDYLISSSCVSGLAPGQSCEMDFEVTPTHTGADDTSSQTSTSAGTITINVKATGVGGKALVSATNINLGPVGVGVTTPDTTVDIKNVGMARLTFAGGGSTNPDWLVASSCALGLDPGQTCQFFFRVTPSITGADSVTSQTTTNYGSFSISAHATGVAGKLVVSPTTIDLGPVPVSIDSTQSFVTITNVGLADVPAWTQASPSNADFSYSTDCSGALAPGSSCSYAFVFTPSVVGREHATTALDTTVGSFTLTTSGTGEQTVG